jgi:hypothetical protein
VVLKSCSRKPGSREEWAGDKCTFQGQTPSTLLPLQKPHLLKFPPLPNSPVRHEPINELTHWWGQNLRIQSLPKGSAHEHWCIGDQASNTWAFGGHFRCHLRVTTIVNKCLKIAPTGPYVSNRNFSITNVNQKIFKKNLRFTSSFAFSACPKCVCFKGLPPPAHMAATWRWHERLSWVVMLVPPLSGLGMSVYHHNCGWPVPKQAYKRKSPAKGLSGRFLYTGLIGSKYFVAIDFCFCKPPFGALFPANIADRENCLEVLQSCVSPMMSPESQSLCK